MVGDVINNSYVIQIQNIFDSDSNHSLMSYRLFGLLVERPAARRCDLL